MKIDVLLSPLNADELHFTGKTTVVIDVLRATTTIVTALQNGAREVVPVGSVDFAMKISGSAAGGQTLLCGERNITMIEGFSLGNSPLEYDEETIKGKTIVFFTTNGSKSIVKAKFSENLLIASFINMNAIVNHLVELGNDVEILCSGSEGKFCIEDTACAGKIISEIKSRVHEVILTDSGRASELIYDSFGKNLDEMLLNCDHGKKLQEKGFADDIKYCSQLSISDIVPYYDAGTIKIVQPKEVQQSENKN
ncbi:MAG: 2-phosphosulfolactate phosphatase [Melioribacteraceae bacterium]|nr:2-phosphosulfolactate phosphatase [Melioribacteraceae bacterium]